MLRPKTRGIRWMALSIGLAIVTDSGSGAAWRATEQPDRVPQDGAPDKEYWLYHGETIPKVNDKPPWPKQDSPWAKAVPKPEVYFDQIDPDENGNATVWYRPREDAGQAPAPGSSRSKEAEVKSEIRNPKSEID